uniref:MANSC domain-containing protein n=1 Tax=Neogobius melanostomus TaxID=47308 RepID=A0A8C6TUS2_9GOBI
LPPHHDNLRFSCVNKMALLQHHRLLSLAGLFLMMGLHRVDARSAQISDIKSKISGVEELLDEFRKQLQQEQEYSRVRGGGDVTDSCVGHYDAAEKRIIRTRQSIEQGATFLLAPDRVYTWRDCLHACCSQTHCTVAVVQEDPSQAGESLCFLFNCTYRGRNHCPDRSDEDFCPNCEGKTCLLCIRGETAQFKYPR